MTLTRANAEFMVVAELSGLMEAAGLGVSYTGSNVYLNGPIGRALLNLGHDVVDITSVSNADVAQVTDAERSEFIDLMVLLTLETLMGWLDTVDITVGPRTEKLSQLGVRVENKIKILRARMREIYGYGLSQTESGYIQLDFVEHDDE